MRISPLGAVHYRLVPLGTGPAWHDVTLSPLATLYKLVGVMMRMIELALLCVSWGAGVVSTAVIPTRRASRLTVVARVSRFASADVVGESFDTLSTIQTRLITAWVHFFLT